MWDHLWFDVHAATMADNGVPYGAIEDAALAIADERIAWVGTRRELGCEPLQLAREVHSAGGRWVTPGLIDCHTHLVYGGHRAAEFEQRLGGATYEEIARAGGGIVSTVNATRAASEDALVHRSRCRLRQLVSEGVTTLEIKSGYGLDTANELKMLRAARRLGRLEPVRVVTTFLGAHALPPEYAGRADDYVDLVCREMLPAVHAAGLADAVDGFCERIAFDTAQMTRVFDTARRLELPVKLHAEQLSDMGGAELVAHYGGLSADHLEYLGEDGARALAASGTVAVLLPGAFYTLRETRLPPIDLLRREGVPMAVSTDCNPGSSPVTSLLLMLNMACTLFRLTPEEALAGVTRNAARALGLERELGTLEVGKCADLVLWDIELPAELAYAVGANPCHQVIRSGEIVLQRD